MKIMTNSKFYMGNLCLLMMLGQNSFASDSELLQKLTQETDKTGVSIMLAGPVVRGVERRHDRRDNVGDRVEDKQDFREERRDCVGEGPDCRSDNRQDNRENTRDRTEERIDNRQDRRRF